jgi:hypothetical protein
MQWPIVLMLTGDVLAAAGVVYMAILLRNDLRARSTLVAKLAEDGQFVAELQRPEVTRFLDHEISRSESKAAAVEIDRLRTLIEGKLERLDSKGKRLMSEPLRQPSPVGRARFVMSIAQLVDRRLQRAAA